MGHQRYLQLKPRFLHAWRMPNTLTCGENESRANVRVMRKEVMDHHHCSKTYWALLYSDYRCDGVVATFLALPPSRLVWPRWWLASWETVTFKNTTGEEEISRKAVFHYLQAVSSSWAWCCVSDSSLMWWQLCYIRTVLCERGQGNIQWRPLVGIFSHQFVFFS